MKTNPKFTGLAILTPEDFEAKNITSSKWFNSSGRYNSKLVSFKKA